MSEPKHRISVRPPGAPSPSVAEPAPVPTEDPIAKAIASVQTARTTMEAQAVELPDGRVVEIGLPQRSVAALVTMIAAEVTEVMQDASTTARLMALTALQPQIEALLYVRSIDGERIMVGNAAQYKGVADRLTDGGIRAVLRAIQHYWPTPSAENLPMVKKNMQ